MESRVHHHMEGHGIRSKHAHANIVSQTGGAWSSVACMYSGTDNNRARAGHRCTLLRQLNSQRRLGTAHEGHKVHRQHRTLEHQENIIGLLIGSLAENDVYNQIHSSVFNVYETKTWAKVLSKSRATAAPASHRAKHPDHAGRVIKPRRTLCSYLVV